MPNFRRRNLALVVPAFLVAFLTTLVAAAAQSPSWFRLTEPRPSIHEASRLASWSESSAPPRRIAADSARLASLPAGRRPDLRALSNRQTEPSAPEILERANRRYLEARTYRDVATATTRLTEPGTDRELSPPQVLALETAFIRGGGCLWRFEERGAGRSPRPYVVWTPDGSQWSSHWALDGQLRRFGANPAMALAPTSGISNGANALILPLLLGDAVRPLLGRGATHLRAPLVAGREVIGDVECDVVRGASPFGNDEVALWIDGSGAIRRFERLRTVDPSRLAMPAAGADGAAPMKPFVARTTVDFQPTFDGGIPAKDLDFQPPPDGAAAPTVEEPPAAPRDAEPEPPSEAPPEAPQASSPEASSILDRARKRYASAKTYRDRMRVASFRGELGGVISPQPLQRLSAETRLVRDGGCHWSFRQVGDDRPGGGYVVWSTDGREWSSHWSIRGEVERFGANAGLAFAGPTGISLGAPFVVLPLLVTRDGMPLLVGSMLELSEARLGDPTTIGGAACDVVKGRSAGGGTEVILWIDADGAIRKAQETHLVDGSKLPRDPDPEREKLLEEVRKAKPWVSVTTYELEPTFDGPVADGELDFRPPSR